MSTPDTTAYLVGGYVVFFSVMLAYLASLFIRWANLQRDLRTLEEIEKK